MAMVIKSNEIKNTLGVYFLFLHFFCSAVKFTHPSNEVSQDDIIVFQDPLVLTGLKRKRYTHVFANCNTMRDGHYR